MSDTPGNEPNRPQNSGQGGTEGGGGSGAAQVLVGIFLILFGLCVTLLGGGCTVMWVYFIANGETGGGLLLLLSLAVLAVGLVTLWVGGKLMLGKYKS